MSRSDAGRLVPGGRWLTPRRQRGHREAVSVTEAIKKARSTDSDQVSKALLGLTVDTPQGKMTIREKDHQATRGLLYGQVVAGGAHHPAGRAERGVLAGPGGPGLRAREGAHPLRGLGPPGCSASGWFRSEDKAPAGALAGGAFVW
ncbi:MAG: transporter substrate-binding protein [Candidatus Rokubacteria bacterium]|nr:transporter substrate-binding protein [Candidatus Rokubacteria bacterium]MBI3103985.1 transporter substrate-binding protein [Candidatus Rokubacteria bacterium]